MAVRTGVRSAILKRNGEAFWERFCCPPIFNLKHKEMVNTLVLLEDISEQYTKPFPHQSASGRNIRLAHY